MRTGKRNHVVTPRSAMQGQRARLGGQVTPWWGRCRRPALRQVPLIRLSPGYSLCLPAATRWSGGQAFWPIRLDLVPWFTVGSWCPFPIIAGVLRLEGLTLEALRQRQRRTRAKLSLNLMASCTRAREAGSSFLDSRTRRVAGSWTGSSTSEVAVRTPRLRSSRRRCSSSCLMARSFSSPAGLRWL